VLDNGPLSMTNFNKTDQKMCPTTTLLFETRVDWLPETSKQPSNKSCEEENWNFRQQSKMYEKGESFSSKFSICKDPQRRNERHRPFYLL
jgi:hypothetical protein